VSPADSLSDERVRELAREILSRPEYARFRPSDLLERFGDWLSAALNWLSLLYEVNPALWYALFLGLVGVALALLVHVVWSVRVALRDDLPAQGYRGIAAFLNRAGERCRAAGLSFAYHNHTVELRRIEGVRSGLDLLLEGTDPALVCFEIDLAWTVAGGGDPRALFAKHPGRFRLCHAKDVNQRGEDLDLGTGIVDFGAVLADAERAGIEHVFVERDTEEDPLRTAARGYAHLARWWSAPGA